MTMYHPKLGLCTVESRMFFGIFSIVSVPPYFLEKTYIVLTKKLLTPIRVVKD